MVSCLPSAVEKQLTDIWMPDLTDVCLCDVRDSGSQTSNDDDILK